MLAASWGATAGPFPCSAQWPGLVWISILSRFLCVFFILSSPRSFAFSNFTLSQPEASRNTAGLSRCRPTQALTHPGAHGLGSAGGQSQPKGEARQQCWPHLGPRASGHPFPSLMSTGKCGECSS